LAKNNNATKNTGSQRAKVFGKKSRKMKRYGNLYEKIIAIENLQQADINARRGKGGTYGVRRHDRHKEENIERLHEVLAADAFVNSKYDVFTTFEPKERVIHRLPYYPDRIVHHAIMLVLEPIWCSLFIRDTFACIKGRGIHDAMRRIQLALQDVKNTKYVLKIDVRKFYPSIDHDVLKLILRRKIKCERTLRLLSVVIDSSDGVPIGNYLSQYFANIYLAYFDHFVKEQLKVKYYYRYADDMVFFGATKQELHAVLLEVNHYLVSELNLLLKSNYQISRTCDGVDVVGYVFTHTHTKMRKSIKKNFARRLSRINKRQMPEAEYTQRICGWLGWAKHCDSKHFLKQNIKEQHYESILRRTTGSN